MKKLRDDMLNATAPDPVLSLDYIQADLGISRSTVYRSVRYELPIVQISSRRLGVKRSDYEAWKAARTAAPGGRAA